MNEVQAIALIVAVTELSKQFIDSKFAPLISMVLGIGAGLYMNFSVTGGIYGLALGLGTTGLYRVADKFVFIKK